MQPQIRDDKGNVTDPSFAVDPAELDAFVEGVQRLETTMATHIKTFESLRLDSGVFGRLPGISSKVHKAYSHHVDEGTKAFDEGKTVLNAAGKRAAESAAAYRGTEQRNVTEISQNVVTLLGTSKEA